MQAPISPMALNNMEFLNSILQELRKSTDIIYDNKDGVSTLGLLWHPRSDRLQEEQPFFYNSSEYKRQVWQ
jgi:hypothetical protein